MRIDYSDQGTFEWHKLRQGIVTGTKLKSALGTKKVQQTLLCELVAERMTEPQITEINSDAVKRGNELEPVARRAVNSLLKHNFEEVGMLVSDDIKGFAVSPDGVVFEGGDVVGGLEIKCPSSKKHIEYLINDELPKEYEAQVKAAFMVSELINFWVFASFDDRNYERPLFIKTIHRKDFEELDADAVKLKQFIASVDASHMALTF